MYTKLIALVPAAGIGMRAQSGAPNAIPKQYRLLRGEPMLRWAVRALLADARVEQVRVAVAAHDEWAEQALAGLPRTVWRPCGGPTRAKTVLAAVIDADLNADDWVLVHDAARPGLPVDALGRLIDHCLHSNSGGLLAQPVADTVKRARPACANIAASGAVGGQGIAGNDALPGPEVMSVQASVPRDDLWLAQTPQMFKAGPLRDALSSMDTTSGLITDEASAMEAAGYAPGLVPGSVRNFKVTWPEDFGLMEKWL